MSQDHTPGDDAIVKSLRLRGADAPVARVSRRALIVVGAIVSAGLAGALGWSLVERHRAAPDPSASQGSVAPPERVTTLPRGYVGPAGVPALGPPLPGDLGRPMLSAARQDEMAGAPHDLAATSPSPSPSPPLPPAIDAEAQAQARSLARRAARSSSLFAASVAASAAALPPAPTGVTAASTAQMGPDARTTSVERLQAPASPYILQAGAVIPAALVTGLRSDAPGVAIAQVTQDVHDSLGGGVLLIPAGARLVGSYDAEVQSGQSRLRVGWTRLILPSGRSIVLDTLPAADEQGMAGLQDGVDRHGRALLAAAGLTTVLAIGAEAGASSEESELARALRRAGADTASQVGQQIVGKSLNLAPTLTIRPGAPLRVLLTRDLVLEPYRERTLP